MSLVTCFVKRQKCQHQVVVLGIIHRIPSESAAKDMRPISFILWCFPRVCIKRSIGTERTKRENVGNSRHIPPPAQNNQPRQNSDKQPYSNGRVRKADKRIVLHHRKAYRVHKSGNECRRTHQRHRYGVFPFLLSCHFTNLSRIPHSAACSASILFAALGVERGGKFDRLFLREISRYDEFPHVDFCIYDRGSHKFAIHDYCESSPVV